MGHRTEWMSALGLTAIVEPEIIRIGGYSAKRREACSKQAFAASLRCISRMTIVKNVNFLLRLHRELV